MFGAFFQIAPKTELLANSKVSLTCPVFAADKEFDVVLRLRHKVQLVNTVFTYAREILTCKVFVSPKNIEKSSFVTPKKWNKRDSGGYPFLLETCQSTADNAISRLLGLFPENNQNIVLGSRLQIGDISSNWHAILVNKFPDQKRDPTSFSLLPLFRHVPLHGLPFSIPASAFSFKTMMAVRPDQESQKPLVGHLIARRAS